MLSRFRLLFPSLLILFSLALGACGSDGDDGPAQAGASGASGASGAAGATTGGALRYAVIGDSNSNGENAGPGQQASPEVAWPAQLAEGLNEEGLSIKLVANPAITGATIEQASAEELPVFEKADPDVATLMIGGNDYVAGVTAEQYRKSYRELLDKMIETVGDPGRVLTVSVPAFYKTPTGATYVDPKAAPGDMAEFNEIARAESEDAGVEFVDIVEVSEAMGDDPSLVTPDGLHPTEKEAGLWTDEIAPVALDRWSELTE